MNYIKRILFFLAVISLFASCNYGLITKKADISRIDTTGIYFTYTHDGSQYEGHFSLYITEEDFHASDTLKITINKNNPKEYHFDSVIEKEWPTEEHIVKIKGDE